MMIRLDVPEGPDGAITSHTYVQPQVRIGSGETNDITLRREGVSVCHATVEVKDDQGILVPGVDGGDLKVNGTPVQSRTLLQPGDRIHIGPVEVLYKLVPFPKPERTRKFSWLEWATVALVAGGVLSQIFFLAFPARSLRNEIRPELLIPPPAPEVEPTPEPVEVLPTPTPQPLVLAPESDPEPTPEPEEDTVPEQDAEIYVREARQFLSDKQSLPAERALREALRIDPGFLPAKVLLARLLADQADYAGSLALWEQIRDQAPAGSAERMDARLEIPSLKRRLELLEQEKTAPVQRQIDSIPVPTPEVLRPAFPTPGPEVVEQAPPLIVENIRMQRYAENPRYDEFRMLTFDLVHQSGTPAVAAGSILVRVTFFEQAGTRVRTADIPNPRILLNVEQGLARNQRLEELSAAYEVPRGKSADGRSYYGAVLEVFVDRKEVHRAADPAFLLEFIR